MRHDLEVRHGHLLRRGPHGLELIDTGSPLSMPLPSEVRKVLGDDVTRLVGMNELAQHAFLLDWANRELDLEPLRSPEGPFIPLKNVLGIPCIEIRAGGLKADHAVPALLDTGAPISYAPAHLLTDVAPHGEATDFYPMIGTFTTPLYHAAIDVFGVTQVIPVGVLPPLLAGLLSVVGPDTWILGGHFFDGRRLHLDMPNLRLTQVASTP